MSKKKTNRSRDEAIEMLECYIIENKLVPHTKLPSERDLCEMWEFNRTTLRYAIQRLIIEGKLYNKKGSGTYVAEPKLIRNLQTLKALSSEVAQSGKELTNKVVSFDIIESNKQLTKKMCLPLGHKLYALSRLRFIDNEPVTIETSFMDCERFKDIKLHDFSKESLYSVIEKDCGVKIIEGEERIGIAYATEYEAELLQIEPMQAVFYVDGIVYDIDQKPVEYFKSIIRADKIKFASILRQREEE